MPLTFPFLPGTPSEEVLGLDNLRTCFIRHPGLATSLRRHVGALFGYGALHHQHQEDQHHPQNGAQPENVKVGQRSGLLLAEVGEDIYAPLLRKGRVSCQPHEKLLTSLQE